MSSEAEGYSRSEKAKFFGFVLFMALVISVSMYFDFHHLLSVKMMRNYIEATGLWGPLIFVVAYVVTSIFFFPATVLSMASGLLWGPYLGTLLTVVAATISAVIPFYISRAMGRGFVKNIIEDNFAGTCDSFLSRNGFLAVFIIRLLPVFPWDMVNYAGGLCGFGFKDYIFATLIGIIPASFTYNLIGSAIGKPFSWTRIAMIGAMVAVLVAAVGGYKIYRWSSEE